MVDNEAEEYKSNNYNSQSEPSPDTKSKLNVNQADPPTIKEE